MFAKSTLFTNKYLRTDIMMNISLNQATYDSINIHMWIIIIRVCGYCVAVFQLKISHPHTLFPIETFKKRQAFFEKGPMKRCRQVIVIIIIIHRVTIWGLILRTKQPPHCNLVKCRANTVSAQTCTNVDVFASHFAER